ncbi:hypothetical protein Tco_0518492, partial [Tanacetum coccineum]
LAYVAMINYSNSVMSSRKSEFPTGLKVADGYANNEGKDILEEHWKKAYC